MTKISNNFLIGTVNKDFDERLVPVGQLTDAENISILTGEEGQKGVVKNALGNLKKTDYATLYGITNARTIGKCISSSEELIYNFVCGRNYDAIIEYNVKSNTSSIVLKASSGGVLNFNNGYRIKGADIVFTSEGEGNLLAWTDNYNPPRIINITRAKLFAVDGFTSEEISVVKAPPSIDLVTTMSQVGIEDGTNFIKDRFISFAYRYKYNDGYYSAISSWTEYCFSPKPYNINYRTLENEGMENTYNTVDIDFNTGNRDVIGIDLLFKESNSSIVYVVDRFIKSEKGWSDNSTQTFTFSENKIYTVLPDSQYFRNFDNVPLLAKAQTVAGNRLMYGNFTEGRDIDEALDYDIELISENTSVDNAVDYTIIDYTLPSTFSNKIEFDLPGVVTLGTDPLDLLTNNFYFPYDGNPLHYMGVLLTFNTSNTSDYILEIRSSIDDSLIYSYGVLSGDLNSDYRVILPESAINFYFCVSSNEGLVYSASLRLTSTLNYDNTGSDIIDYTIRKQLSLPKSPAPYTYQINGDVVRDGAIEIDFTGFEFQEGLQMSFQFDLISYYEFNEGLPVQSYEYMCPQSYATFADFYNLGFKNKIENVWSTIFENTVVSGDGLTSSFTGFKTSISGNILTIKLPYAILSVSEDGGNELKPEFFGFKDDGFNLYSSLNGFFKSLHSNRDYEISMIYMDKEGRKTTALVCSSNIINIPAYKSSYINKLQVTTNHNPPSWADRYKFAVKQIKGDYETIYSNAVLKDQNDLGYRWILLSGENKNKVKEGDELIVKRDSNGVVNNIKTVKAIEVKEQVKDFITGVSSDAGLYLKIEPKGVSVDPATPIVVSESLSQHYQPYVNLNLDTTIIPTGTIIEGTKIKVYVYSDEFSNGNAWSYDRPYFTSNSSYDTFRDWFETEFPEAWGSFDEDHIIVNWTGDTLFVQSREDGYSGSGRRYLFVEITVIKSTTLILETTPIENKSALFFESPNTYKITNGLHNSGDLTNQNVHLLTDVWNCFCFGNGAESYKIKDKFNAKSLSIDFNPTAVTEDRYRRINRFADITYSEVFQESTNVNKLNEFNLYLANYKDDLDKSFGTITTIKGFDTNLDVIQEDKYSVVFYGKDLLYNADGSTNLQKIPEVLGQQKAYDGEYGSQFSDSFDFYGFNRYFADYKRGTIMVKTNNGLINISEKGMNDYFTSIFRDNIIHNIIGQYDQYLDSYILNIQYGNNQYVTWLYSEESKGWTTRHTFNPEHIVRLNGDLYSFKNGEIYHHNHNGIYNTFYGVQSPSIVSFNMNVEPGTRKVFRTLSLEGTDSWDTTVVTDLQSGYINSGDFLTKEGVKYAYIRGNDSAVDTATPSVQGIGIVSSISGNNVITGNSVASLVSVGDKVYTSSMLLIGTITNILSNGVTLNSVVGLNLGDFILGVKPQEVETSGLLGYYMNVTLELDKNTKTELYEVNSEVSKSFM